MKAQLKLMIIEWLNRCGSPNMADIERFAVELEGIFLDLLARKMREQENK